MRNRRAGPALNVVPRTGGNAVKGSVYLAGVSGGMVGDNYTQALKDAGLSVPGQLLKLWDVNGGIGGPIRKDRLWYFLNVRDEGSFRSVPGMYANLNVGDPTKWTYVPDLDRQAQTAGSWTIANLRLTTQVTPRNKINLFWDEQMACSGAPWSASIDGCRAQASSGAIIAGGSAAAGIGATTTAINAPETASYTSPRTPQRVQQLTWQSPTTNRLLLEAGVGTFLNRWGGQEIPGNPTRDIVRVVEQCTAGCANNGNIANLTYRSQNWADHWMGTHTWRASASYVTGAQNIKIGYQGGLLVDDQRSVTNTQNLQFRFNNGVPNQITENLLPIPVSQRARYDAVYAQEQWTHKRLTRAGGGPIRPGAQLFPGGTGRADAVSHDADPVCGDDGCRQLQGHLAAWRRRLRSVRQREDVDQSERRPVSRGGPERRELQRSPPDRPHHLDGDADLD